ncbi:uroporphyrinogen-III C-methyltransferase [Polynucleobacter sp. AP-Ainpum-60-G11]|uniref:uroporphyrinogen-III C-methyltransferase n=1 Tax=Polynucleobacter sp. AP-Ainpum-60-G11 TaxID=2576926 RepID=UPI001BFDCFB1|nr:uroporphyrinogen-III C-methyltransferase [Polynucleobacter sp. AP-Ainpum-60-G11]QWE27037.1 uroporphyrinogen-III C-methyltransferase [Polynucleobacter sp. AP-Ainpum-60-G11]
MTSTFGKVFLVGAGPGAVDLITVRGAKLLEKADIVFYDALVDPAMLELCPQAIKEPVGKRCGKPSCAQHFINKRLVDAAHKYQIIVRLKGGDPMMFGRADEEIQALKNHHIEIEVVPGITAALAGAATIQQSLTLRGVSRSVAFVTLTQTNETFKTIKHPADQDTAQPIQNPSADTVVYYMGRKDASNIAKQLVESNSQHTHETPVHILEAVSTKNERHWLGTLGQLADGKVNDWFDKASPALIMVGEALREKRQSANRDANQSMKTLPALKSSSPKVNDGLQDSCIFSDSRRSA